MSAEHKILAVFGSTGSIGRNTLEVVRRHPEHFSVRYLTGNSNADLMIEQVKEFRPAAVAVTDGEARRKVRDAVGEQAEVLDGSGLTELAAREDYHTMVSSLVGFAGLLPTTEAIRAGKHIALANKETLVVAGEVITGLLREHGVQLVPIDSEHSAIQQCIVGEPAQSVARIILTASGGPFRGRSAAELEHVTPADALKHPNWSMGSKISIDSATLMNKGLEVIEAHWLFDVAPGDIDVVVHPQSIIHSMVEFSDGSLKAQLGVPDMKIPIHYALTWPDRIAADYERADMARIGTLTFEEPDRETFPCLQLAFDSLQAGGTAPAVLNAANEVGVAAFLRGDIPFPGIPAVIADALDRCDIRPADTLETVVEADREAREFAEASLPHYSSVTTTRT